MAATIRVKADTTKISAALHEIEKQIPYATARAINDIAFQVQRAERANIAATFKHPRPFTVRSVTVDKADKRNLTATVSVRPEVAKYLAPYEFGGLQVLGNKRAMLTPKNIALDPYGNIPRGRTRRLAARKNVFAGRVQGVAGFWERLKGHRLKLLIRFSDPVEVKQHLGFRERGEALVRANFAAAFSRAIDAALATARK